MNSNSQVPLEEEQSFERIVFFSDAVFAIAITLLALEIRLGESSGNLGTAIIVLLPSIGVYALSFIVIGVYWVGHHRMFRMLSSYNYALIWLNLLFLLCVAFLPVANSVLAAHYQDPIAFLFYGIALSVTSFASLLLWLYAGRQPELHRPGVPQAPFRTTVIRSGVTIAVAFIAILLAFWNSTIAFLFLSINLLWSIFSSTRGQQIARSG
jgi:uncharacterized membrane protein